MNGIKVNQGYGPFVICLEIMDGDLLNVEAPGIEGCTVAQW